MLKPEFRDQTITKGVEQAVRHAHDSYRRVVANGDMRLQLFLAKHTSHLEDVPPATPMSKIKLDWDAQKWKAPTYLMEDRAFDGVVGVGTAAAGGTVGALALGPAINGVLAQSFGQLSRRVATSLGTRIAFAQQGAVAGTVVQPVGGQVVGAAIGVMIGAAVDYLSMPPTRPSTARASSPPTRRPSTPPSPPGRRGSRPISIRPSTSGSTMPAPRWCSPRNRGRRVG